MKSNKQKWAERNANHQTKFDVNLEAQIKTIEGTVMRSKEEYDKQHSRVVVDAKAEATEGAQAVVTRKQKALDKKAKEDASRGLGASEETTATEETTTEETE